MKMKTFMRNLALTGIMILGMGLFTGCGNQAQDSAPQTPASAMPSGSSENGGDSGSDYGDTDYHTEDGSDYGTDYERTDYHTDDGTDYGSDYESSDYK